MKKLPKLFAAFSLGALLVCQGGCLPALFGIGGATVIAANQDRSLCETKEDVKLWLKVEGALKSCSFDDLENVSVRVIDRRVFLIGKTRSQHVKEEIKRVVGQQKDIVEIIDNIEVDSNRVIGSKSLFNRRNLEAKKLGAAIKVGLASEYGIKSNNYKVCALEGTVYLMGVTHSKAERDMALERVSRTQGVKRVVSYVIVR